MDIEKRSRYNDIDINKVSKNKIKNKKIKIIFFIILILGIGYYFYQAFFLKNIQYRNFVSNIIFEKYTPTNPLEKEAYSQIGVVTKYDFKQGYYAGGRPKDKSLGVCTDVVGDALKKLGYDLQEKVYNDIKKRPKAYNDKPDKNINHRRSKNLAVYFGKYEKTLPLDFGKSLETWKAGDIVVWKNHIGVVSGQKRSDGVPYVISNHGSGVMVADILDSWEGSFVVGAKLIGHFRIKEFSE